MELVKPGIGLIIWMIIGFGILFFILAKFIWPAILKGLKEREQSIENSLREAEKAREEMKGLHAENESLLQEAREERDLILRDARKTKDDIINEAKEKATTEANRIVKSAKERIENEKMAAITDLKNQIASLSIEMAEKVLQKELSDKKKHQDLVEKLINEIKFN